MRLLWLEEGYLVLVEKKFVKNWGVIVLEVEENKEKVVFWKLKKEGFKI